MRDAPHPVYKHGIRDTAVAVKTQYPLAIIPVAVEYFAMSPELFGVKKDALYANLKEFLGVAPEDAFSCLVRRSQPFSACTDGVFSVGAKSCGSLSGSIGDIIIRQETPGGMAYAVIPTSRYSDESPVVKKLMANRKAKPFMCTTSFTLSAEDFGVYTKTILYLA